MTDIKDKDDSVETADTADTADTKSQTGTRGEWIFFIREGDGLHEDDDDSRCSKNLTLFLVVLIPIAWIVVPILFLKKCKMPCAKETKNSKVSSAMIIKNRKD
ncbi:uncharacterized protein LOC127736557 [Mytilus californianus]|uniref:uncharacterized protein LOC127736557 n=1 Tax=Mytilus californianus TaxID=6549 RepID=UPI002246C06E|nr:uncharacterized protein LOC127736557 [Mytilus californianus]